MRHRPLSTALALVVATLATALAAPPSTAAPAGTTVVASAPAAPAADPGPAAGGAESGTTVLVRATDALGGGGATRADRPDATLALRDLFLARARLGEVGDRFAGGLLARPTDGDRDPYADGYSARQRQRCGAKVCVHWVNRTEDRASRAWVDTTLRVMGKVWKHHVRTLGYRPPAPDGRRGGNALFDVYLKDLGSKGVYGYCAPERKVPGESKQASGFCVLDNDFAREQFGRRPLETLRVTAAHEFFHAIQFAHDFGEDPWLMESTATWIEGRFAARVDDNRIYLPYGQLGRPGTSLDLYEPSGYAHYGNWTFWEFLADRLGPDVVRDVWWRAGTGGRMPDDYSTQALRRVLAEHGGLRRRFAAYAAGNTMPARTYPEGSAYAAAPVTTRRVTASRPRVRLAPRIDHLSSRSVVLRPGRSLARRWRLEVRIDGPDAVRSPAALVTVRRADGSVQRRQVRLDRTGAGRVRVAFGRRAVRTVTVTLANASTRVLCDTGTSLACQGSPLDDRVRFRTTAVAVRR
ncbi:MXAN_6640 family putative metalloprotease [Nocardioides dongxiaopingii]|uniref:MXAN_6640 family putative metalloprotease n=1 Tax=Nocardioides dongxiaopingii TaxID=2576036 RepID=UPI0010C761E1|nr:MXAN_6640 family putative metalloprotease [Nocardioides dongxiaopingii]